MHRFLLLVRVLTLFLLFLTCFSLTAVTVLIVILAIDRSALLL